MIVFPAIDLKQGQVVRLAEGDMARATVYGEDPTAQALLFAEAGAEHLHVVDLDGSFAGRAENRAAVEAIVEAFPGYVQLGGGIRNRFSGAWMRPIMAQPPDSLAGKVDEVDEIDGRLPLSRPSPGAHVWTRRARPGIGGA